MKVGLNPISEAIRSLNLVREKDEQSSRQQKKQDQKKKDEEGEFETELQVSEEQVTRAVEGFQHDTQAQANHLVAEKQGSGPGLKVVLRDESGVVVRQFTGEEFMRLREAASHSGGKRGKILDQKF